MANYYVNPNGSETYPFDTEAKGAKDVNRLYKYLDNSNSEFIDVDFDNYSSAIEVMPNHIAPFPKGEEKVIFKTTVKEHEIMPIYMGEIHGYSQYSLPSGCILGTQNISLSVWSFKTVTTWDDSMGRVTYTNHIRKGSTDIKTFVKPFDISVSYYWVVDEYFVDMFVVPEDEELDLEAEPEWHNNHGQTNWASFFGLEYSYQKYASSLIGSISDGRTHIYSMSSYALDKPAIALTADDIIYLSDGVEEESGLNGTDTLPDSYTNFNSFGYATLRSIDDVIKSKWTLSDSNYCFANLNLDNLDIFTTSYNEFSNPTKISNCYFHDFSWCGVSFSDWIPYLEGDITCEISNNTFDNSMIYDSEGKYSLKINNNIFKNEGMIYCDDSWGRHNIYNNIFENNSYISIENSYEAPMQECIICNNTFTLLDSGYDAINIVWMDNYGATMSLKLFNNIVDSGSIYIRLTAANPANILNFLHSNNCCPTYDYMLNGAAVAPNENEISEAPLFDVENLSSPLMLLESSPCYGTGLLDPETPALDFLGAKRKTEPGPDMGAFETVASETPTSPRWGKASDYLIQQYKDGESLPSVVDLHSDRLMEIADSIATMPLSTLSVDTAEGVQLDRIGEVVDAGRGVLSDSAYRLDIVFMQTVNSAGGNAAIIIDYIKWYCGPYFSTMFLDEGNASVNLQLATSGTLPTGFMEELVYQLSRIVPAAVEGRLFHSADGDIFAVADEGGEVTLGAGFSEEDNESPYTDRTTGGQFVDPIRI